MQRDARGSVASHTAPINMDTGAPRHGRGGRPTAQPSLSEMEKAGACRLFTPVKHGVAQDGRDIIASVGLSTGWSWQGIRIRGRSTIAPDAWTMGAQRSRSSLSSAASRAGPPSSGSKVRGEVALGLPTTVALVATLPIFQATRERYPDIRLKIVESHSGFLAEWLQSGRLDLGVLFMAGTDPAFDQKALLAERLVWVTAPDQVPAPREVTLAGLARCPMVLPAREHGLRRIVDEACAQAGVTLDVIGEIDSLPNIKKAVQAGIAGTILSPGAVAEEVRAGHLTFATIRAPHIVRTIASAMPRGRPITPAAATRAATRRSMSNLLARPCCPRRSPMVIAIHAPVAISSDP